MTEYLRCARCRRDRTLRLAVDEVDEREVRQGRLRCLGCGWTFPVQDGIADLLYMAPEFVTREAAGLQRFADVMRADGWDRDRILALPDVHLGYWVGQAAGMRRLLATQELEPGRRILDVGSNTCWASNIFAKRGLEVVALDIAKAELQGLRTADYFLETGNVYFERLLSPMFAPALASGSMDYVFCCEVLHHNDRSHLRRTMRELYRVLRPGGKLMVLNEPLRFPLNLKRDHAQEVEAFEGNEHVHFFHDYYLAARLAGFKIHVRHPPRDPLPQPSPAISGSPPLRHAARRLVARGLHSQLAGRRLVSAYQTLLTGDVNLSLVATKPGRLGAPAGGIGTRGRD